jgi:chromate transporter
MTKVKLLWTLYHTFLKIGGFTLGGGYAMIPIIQREAVETRKWVSEDEMLDILTLAQSMPGVIGINSATSLGIKVAGIPGALAATFGMVTIPIVFIIILATVFSQVMSYVQVQWAFVGVRAAVAALMAGAVLKLLKNAVTDIFQDRLFLGAIAGTVVFGIQPQYVLVACAVTAILYSLIKQRKAGAE